MIFSSRFGFLISLAVSSSNSAFAQNLLISSKNNKIDIVSDSVGFKRLFKRLDTLVRFGVGQVNIVHIGGSHVQADIYSNRIRERLRTYFPGFEGPRGFVFPYTVARTNNPSNYKVEYGGQWKVCKNVNAMDCSLGIAGINVSTGDSSAWIRIIPSKNENTIYSYNKIRLYYERDTQTTTCMVSPRELVDKVRFNENPTFIEYKFKRPCDTIQFQIKSQINRAFSFTLHGIQFLSDEPGVIYHSLGVNGAATSSFLRCALFVDHLRELKPDLIIFSLGVNDAHGPSFSKDNFKRNYERLMVWVKEAAPLAAVLFVTNNDTYIRRRYINENHPVVKECMYEIAEKFNGAVWNLYDLMGARGSMMHWHNAGLAQSDLIHFTTAGYHHIGDRLFEAFIKLWADFNRVP